MSEITKLYENAEVKKQIPKVCSSNELYCKECEAHIEDAMPYCKNAEYPPFTAEKQLNLIKLLILNYSTEITKGRYTNYFMSTGRSYKASGNDDLIICMANLINNLWQDLTEEERKQIKEILE